MSSLPRSAPAAAALLLPLVAAGAFAQDPQPVHPAPEVAAVAAAEAITVDGVLGEEVWARAEAAGGFRQSEPNEGDAATQHTEVRFAYDDQALYIGARMRDEQGADGVRTRLVRRDGDMQSDFLRISLDTYHDHVGSTMFQVNPSGVKVDAANGDHSWDPIWEYKARTDSAGWTAELRIPFSQLRFAPADEQTWGVQLYRQVERLNERSQWSFWRREEQGGPARYGHLTGLRIPRATGRLEALPYVVAQSAHLAPGDASDPFFHASDRSYRMGVDLKYLVTSNLTLSATLNPDFGQVEVDPAVVNLSAFETFFPERRPFFVEGSDYFGFSPFWCISCTNASSLGLFYSRRIGRAPQGLALAAAQSRYLDAPDNTTILGAAKLTGRTAGGWSVGLLNAVTAAESAPVLTPGGAHDRLTVEPRTNYFVGRVRRDLAGGDWRFGAMATSVLRDLGDARLAGYLSRHAESVGIDAEGWWADRTYHLLFGAAATQVAGEPEAILRAQRSSARYFQRPDREHGSNGLFTAGFDENLGVMRGYGLYSRIAKDAGNFRWEAAANLRSPGFENNDVAFLTRADYVWLNTNVFYQFTEPTRWYRRANLVLGAQQESNFAGDLTDRRRRASAWVQLPNYWQISSHNMWTESALDDRLTRGGPAVATADGRFHTVNLSTDRRRALSLSTNVWYQVDEDGYDGYGLGLGVRVRPAANVSLSAGPNLQRTRSQYQYVTRVTDATADNFFGSRYVFAEITRRTLSLDTRLNATFSPSLSLELFAQPFIASGDYDRFKEFARPRDRETRVFGEDVGTLAVHGEPGARSYRVDPDGTGPAEPFTLRDPDFNFRSLRGNAVLRWEYRPGSTLFLVWTQDRSDIAPLGDLELGRDRAALFDAEPDNIFLVKVNYWLGR